MVTRTRRIIDADGHVAEDSAAIIARMPEAYREKAREQRRHVIAEGDDALYAMFQNSRHDFFEIGHVSLDERHVGYSPLRRRWDEIEGDDLGALSR